MDIYIPEEILRHILSYLALPYMTLVSRYFNELEGDINDKRYENYTARYESIDNAVSDGHWDMVGFLLDKAYIIDDMLYVCRHIGRYGSRSMIMNAIRHNIDESYNVTSYACYGAARGGHKDIVQWMIDFGADNYDLIAECAAENGHRDIVQDMLDKGVDNYNEMAYIAAENGYRGIVQWMIDLGVDNYNEIAYFAAEGGHRDIIQDMLDKGADNYNEIAKGAAEGGHKDIIQDMIDLDASDYESIANTAIYYDHEELAEWVLSHRMM